uniref:SCAPER_N domain-containing protein n=1 Tax=Caenorhabditis tropicalis TaxID=1561998 RepID=A0A1I7T734_9PELO
MTTVEREKAESIVSRSSKKKKNRKKRARQWTGYVENLKTNIDLMYEMCRSEQSVAGCREAMLYLQSASNDFKSLIETINVEKQWDQDENNPHQDTIKRPSVAWEVRKSMSSPNPALPISTIIAEAVKNVAPSSGKASEPPTSKSQSTLTYARITAAAAVAAVAVSNNQSDDGWKLVTNRRRKSTSSTTVSEYDREFSVEKEIEKDLKSENAEPLNVYERLSSTSYKRGPPTRALTCPKSAMDLPQTRASMAKMAYSRQLLWEKNQQVLVEKLRQKQKKEKTVGRSGSQCGFTFADPQAVRKSVEAFNQHKIGSRRTGKETPSTSSNAELQSIHEESHNPASENSDDVPADPTPSSSISQPQGSLFGYVQVPEDIEKDDEWREMTEEEESLALEENSLKLEIKQAESMEIDAELERQVEMEADNLEREERALRRSQRKEEKQEKNLKEQEKLENLIKAFEEIRNQAWSEIMEQESTAQYQKMNNIHEPGTPVERHEKMLSPSRRRCQKDDDDFGKRHEMKQKHAEELRQQLQNEKAMKLKELTSRVEEVRAKQEAVKERKRQLLAARMQRASDNRDKNIMEVVRRAKDDDQRVMEVKFIATLQEDNKRYELLAKDASVEEKQKQLADERARKQEEKAQKKREQEAAATARRLHAAEARQEKIRRLNEQKILRSMKNGIPNPNAPEDMVLYLHSLVSEVEEPSLPPYTWPSSAPSNPRECTLCPSTIIHSDLEAAAHVVCSKEHQNQAKMLTSGSQVEELKRHLFTVFKEASVKDSGENEDQERNKREEEMLKARGILEKLPLGDSLPGAISSPRNRTKYVREFNLAIEKLASSASSPSKSTQLDDKTQEQLEKALGELVTAIESDQKSTESSSSLNIDQFCAVQGPQKMLDILLDWTKNGASLRLCIRICHAFCVFLKDPKVAYNLIFKADLLRLIDKILELIQTLNFETQASKAPQLSALLDILATCFKTAVHRSTYLNPFKKEKKEHKQLQKLDCYAAEAITATGALLETSLSFEDIKNALSGSRGPVMLATRLLGLAEHTTPDFLQKMSSSILEHTYNNRKLLEATKNPDKLTEKSTRDLVQMTISLFSQNEAILESCFQKSLKNLVMWIALMEDSIWRCLQNVKEQESTVERASGSLSKEEESLCKLIQQLGKVVEGMKQYEKRCTMISWTTGQSSCLNILLQKIPIRLLSIGKHSSRIIPTVTAIMDRLTNSEKSEMLGDTSADWFFENSMFPDRVVEEKY